MTLEEYSLTAFTVLNGARIVAYVPQVMCVYRDRTGASSVSMMTWGMFFLANVATVFYALATNGDRIIAGVFSLNAIACVVIFALILRSRVSHTSSSQPGAGQHLLQPDLLAGLSGLATGLRQRVEDRIARRHAGDRWSDAIERSINEEWQDYRCGRLW